MKIIDYSISLKTNGFCHVIDLTSEIQEKVTSSGLWNGQILVFVVGATAGVTTVEYEPGLVRDLEELFNRLAPPTIDYHHEETWHDGNGFSHVRASLLKPSLTVPLIKGRMHLGTWQQIVLIDFDNRPRNREVLIQVTGLEREAGQ